MADKDLIEEAREWFGLCATAEQERRRLWLEDVRFAKLDQQWDDDAIALRKGRPRLTINALAPVIRQIVNDGRQNKPAITVHPADSKADPETAKIIAGLIRQIEYASDAQTAYDTGLDHAASGGFGYWKVNTAYTDDDSFDQDIRIERITNPLSIYGDPYSTAADSSDWTVAFEVELIEKKRFGRLYKGADDTGWFAEHYTKLTSPWVEDDRVLVANWWRREEEKSTITLLSSGDIMDLKLFEKARKRGELQDVEPIGQTREVRSWKVGMKRLTGTETLETLDWAGKFIPIVPCYGEEVNVEGERHFLSAIRSSKDAQRNFNYWRSAAAEAVALAPKIPFIGPVGAFDTDEQKWARANIDNHAYLQYDVVPEAPSGGRPERQGNAGVPSGMLQEALNASDDIKRTTGLYDASMGARSNETSGVAINARKVEGDVSTFHFQDNLTRAIGHTGRIVVDLLPHVITADRAQRILGPEGPRDIQTVQIGRPEDAEAASAARELLAQQGMKPEQATPEVRDLANLYVLGVGKYDVTVSAGPSYTTQRQETASRMESVFQAAPALIPLLGDIYFRNLDVPGGDEMAERLEKTLPPHLQKDGGGQPQGDPQAQAQLQQAAQMAQQAMAKVQELSVELQQAREANEIKAAEVQVKGIEAQAKLLDAQTRARAPIFPGGVPQGAFAA